METIGKRLLHVRDKRSQKEMADELNIALGTYSNYERDERTPDATMLARLYEAGWNINWLLTGDGVPRNDETTNGTEPNSVVLKAALKLAFELPGARDALPEQLADAAGTLYFLLLQDLPEAKVIDIAKSFTHFGKVSNKNKLQVKQVIKGS